MRRTSFSGAALVSVPAIIYSVYYFGDFLESVVKWIKKVEGGIVGVILIGIAFLVFRWWWKKRKEARKKPNEL